MNRLLAGTLGFFNSFFAVLTIAFFTLAGYAVSAAALTLGGWMTILSPFFTAIGFVVGLVIATIFFGLMAVFLDIRIQLIKLNTQTVARNENSKPAPTKETERIEPKLAA